MKVFPGIMEMKVMNLLNIKNMSKKKSRRYIKFYKLHWVHLIPYISEYGLMCSRNWWQCFKLGLRHMKLGKASFFIIEKREFKRSKPSH